MAANLCRAGLALTVYNRSAGPCATLRAAGATVVDTPGALFAACDAVILMLADDAAVDFVLDRHGPEFSRRVSGRLVINSGTHAPAYSRRLEADIRFAGGAFVEAPVSGSRLPAETGDLIIMLGGEADAVARAKELVAPMCREALVIGAVPSAMAMKLAVNLYLVATVAALAEAANLARALGLDLEMFRRIIGSGPLRSDVAAAKLDKMVRLDFAPQAAITDVCKNAALVASVAEDAGAAAPLLGVSHRLFETAREAGAGALDMAAVVTVFGSEAREPT
jgi:3-hydroxyisobutyrate dehydrogenase